MGNIEGSGGDLLKLGKKGSQIDLNAFNGKGIKKNDINKSIFEKFDFNNDGKLDEKEVEVLKAFLLNRAGDDGILSKREIKNVKQFGTKKSDINNFYAALNDMYTQQTAANKLPEEKPPVLPVQEEETPFVEEPAEEPAAPAASETPLPEEAEKPQDKNYQYKVNYKDTWYGIVQAKYGITDHKQTMEIVRQLKAQNNADPKAANMPEEITLPDNIILKDGTEVKMSDINASSDQSHWGYKTTSKTGRYTITQNGETKYYAADGTELKQSYYEAVEASSDKRKISENGSGRYSYTTENGDTYYFAADGTMLKKEYYERRENEYTAVNAQKETVKNARAAFNKQQDEDGWAGKTADAVSVLWNSDNRAVKVEEDLKTYENQIKELQTAQSKGAAEFSSKFKEIYGVDYNPANIAEYEANPTDENYKKAYGTKNDIHKRVMDYNRSQQTGAEVVKGAATVAAGIAVGVATGGTGFVAMGAAAAGTAAASAAINTSDRLTSNAGLKEGELGDIAKNAVIDGAAVLAGGVIGKAASAAVKGVNTASTAARAGINAAGDVAIGAGTEYMQTGQVTLEGTAINAATAGIGLGVESGAFKNVANKVRNKMSSVSSKVPKTKTDIPAQQVPEEAQPVRVSKEVKGDVNNHRDVISDGETARNINQQHLNENQRKMIDEALEDVPARSELDAYAEDIAYKVPAPDEQAALDARQAQVKKDYDEARRIENNAVIKDQKTPSAVKGGIDKLNDEIKGLDGSIKRLEQQIAGAKRFGKDTGKMETQLVQLQEKRSAKMAEIEKNIKTAPETSAQKAGDEPAHTPQNNKNFANLSDEISTTFGFNTQKKLSENLKINNTIHIDKGDVHYEIKNENGQIVIKSKTPRVQLNFDLKLSNRTPAGRKNPGISMNDALSEKQKQVYNSSYQAFMDTKNKKIMHEHTDKLTTDNIIHGAGNLDALINDGGILDNGFLPRELTGNVSAHYADGSIPDTLTPLCTDVWDIRQNTSIKNYFDAKNSHWNNEGEANFLPNSSQIASRFIVVMDKNSIDPRIINNSFEVNANGKSVLFENGNMSRGHDYPTHRAIPIGAPSNSIEKIIIDTRVVSSKDIGRLKAKIARTGLDIKLYDLNGVEINN